MIQALFEKLNTIMYIIVSKNNLVLSFIIPSRLPSSQSICTEKCLKSCSPDTIDIKTKVISGFLF